MARRVAINKPEFVSPDMVPKDDVMLPPVFVASTPGEQGATIPLSFVQASFVVGGKLLTFKYPLPNLDANAVMAAVKDLISNAREAT